MIVPFVYLFYFFSFLKDYIYPTKALRQKEIFIKKSLYYQYRNPTEKQRERHEAFIW